MNSVYTEISAKQQQPQTTEPTYRGKSQWGVSRGSHSGSGEENPGDQTDEDVPQVKPTLWQGDCDMTGSLNITEKQFPQRASTLERKNSLINWMKPLAEPDSSSQRHMQRERAVERQSEIERKRKKERKRERRWNGKNTKLVINKYGGRETESSSDPALTIGFLKKEHLQSHLKCRDGVCLPKPEWELVPEERSLVQWGKKVFSQPPIVQVLPLKKMREACNFHHRYTSTMRDKMRKKNPENHIV